ncbi:tetratricopeptide repeat protein [Desulfosarcina ovata]|uniref:Uncharacterized protein n=1 Tax=Desulfosarcina ovata subsp. ovata TaxID=2752305 RepID=A0A5K8A744_9BACT|nr:tetratricopeptide repeat-containing glycosyltransferase family protein [Desulfosarcina ovata]BBO88345.1 hypothetical protein DSCOOX_15250 [Desulfosarcina ovata subsp. ovata]
MSPKEQKTSGLNTMFKTAVKMHNDGDLDGAGKLYQLILEAFPEHANTLHLMGLVCREKGALGEARSLIQRAIGLENNVPVFYVSLGETLQSEGKTQEAMNCYQKALELAPNMIEALCSLGNLLRERGDCRQAVICYQKAIRINPQVPQLFNNLGLAYQQQDECDAAEACFKKAISMAPELIEALNNLGNLYRDASFFELALNQYQRALTLAPHNTSVNYNIGLVYQSQQREERSAHYFRKAVEYHPPIADAYHNLGQFHQDQNRPMEAIRYYEKAIMLDPHHFDAQLNRSLSLLSLGRFKEGWDAYEWRFKRDIWKRVYPHCLKGRRWDGRAFSGKTLLVHSEQGFGDTIWFARYLKQVKSLGGKVIFEVRSELFDLMKSVDGVDSLVSMSFESPPDIEYDWYIPLMSLARVFETTLETIPVTVPYLYASDDKRRDWVDRAKGPELKVGLVWAAKSTNANNRSCPAERLLPLCNLKDVRLFGLQKGDDAVQADHLPTGFINLGPDFQSFADTAAVIDCLDLVISVDTSVAHLAGAMGKPVWVILPYAADWKWMMEQHDSPWYPTMRLFRQQTPDNWESIVKIVVTELKRLTDR